MDISSNVNQEETKSLGRTLSKFYLFVYATNEVFYLYLVPNIPLPETPIDATDCRLNLLLHISDMQNEVNTRLESLEGLFEGEFDLQTLQLPNSINFL